LDSNERKPKLRDLPTFSLRDDNGASIFLQ
jgi:hypothetical protein